jgi:hypothetical protein
MAKSIVIQCPSCRGTGLYKGFMEAEGEAVICASCSGTGAQELRYEEFTGRKRKNGVRKIRAGSGTILDNPGRSAWITYEEFERKIPAGK